MLLRRSRPHVLIKSREGCCPPIANRDAASAVILIRLVFRVVAPLNQPLPNRVLRSLLLTLSSSVPVATLHCFFAIQASARLHPARSKRVRSGFAPPPALAPAKPVHIAAPDTGALHDGQAGVHLAQDVVLTATHRHHYIILSSPGSRSMWAAGSRFILRAERPLRKSSSPSFSISFRLQVPKACSRAAERFSRSWP